MLSARFSGIEVQVFIQISERSSVLLQKLISFSFSISTTVQMLYAEEYNCSNFMSAQQSNLQQFKGSLLTGEKNSVKSIGVGGGNRAN